MFFTGSDCTDSVLICQNGNQKRVQLKVMGFNLNMDSAKLHCVSGFRRNDRQHYYSHAGLDPASSFFPTVLIIPIRKP